MCLSEITITVLRVYCAVVGVSLNMVLPVRACLLACFVHVCALWRAFKYFWRVSCADSAQVCLRVYF